MNKTSWDSSKPGVVYIGYNPSDKINNEKLTKTGKRLRNIAADNGYGSYYLVNLYPIRHSNPKSVDRETLTEETIEKNNYVLDVARNSGMDVCLIWSKHGGPADSRMGKYVLGLNKDGSPKHPLYIKKGTKFKQINL